MVASHLRSSGGRGLPSHLTGAGARSGVSLEDFEERGFFSRFVGDLADVAKFIGPALAEMGGAVASDTVGRAVRGLVPGGEDAAYGVQSWDSIIKPVGKSLYGTAEMIADVPTAAVEAVVPGGDNEAVERLKERKDEFFEHPGHFAIEHVGNVAIVGAGAAQPLKAGARKAAGAAKPVKGGTYAGRELTNRAATRQARRQQIADIAKSGEAGSGMAKAARISGDLVGHPYQAAARGAVGAPLPGSIFRTPEGEQQSLRGVVGEFRDSSSRRLTEDGLEVAPKLAPEELSPVGATLRAMGDSPLGEAVADSYSKPVRATKGLINDLNQRLGRSSSERMLYASPEGREAAMRRSLALAAKDNALPEGVIPEGRSVRFDRGVGDRGQRLDHGELRDALYRWRTEGEVTPDAADWIDLSILDQHEKAAGLASGSLRNQLMLDLELGGKYQDFLEARRALGDLRAVDPTELGLPESYNIPEEHLTTRLADQPEAVQDAYGRARETLRQRGVTREVDLANLGMPAREWALQAEEAGDGTFRAAEERPDLETVFSSKQSRALKGTRKRLKSLDKDLKNLHRKAESTDAAERASILDDHRRTAHKAERLSRSLREQKMPQEVAARIAEDIGGLQEELRALREAAGYRTPDNLARAENALADAVDAPSEAHRGLGVDDGPATRPQDLTGAAKGSQAARRALEERMIRDQANARTTMRSLERAEDRLARANETLQSQLDEYAHSLEAAPAVARPYLEFAREVGPRMDERLREVDPRLADQLKLGDLPDTIEKLNQAGVTQDLGFVRRLEELGDPPRGQLAASERPLATPRMGTQRRRTMGDMDREFDLDKALAQQDLEVAVQTMKKEAVENFGSRFARPAEQVAQQLADADMLDIDAWRDMSPQQKQRALGDLGFNQYDPEALFNFKTKQANLEGMWIPKYLNDALAQHTRSGAFDTFVREGLNPVMQEWKRTLLPLRPAWLVNNALGNATMSMVHGRMDPVTYLKFVTGEGRQMYRDYKRGLPDEELAAKWGLTRDQADQLFEGGLSQDLAMGFRGTREQAQMGRAIGEKGSRSIQEAVDRVGKEATSRLGRAYDRYHDLSTESYRVNSFTDNLNRSAVYLNEMQRTGDVESALRLAREALGDYLSMTPVERTYLRTMFPFYAWMRHITSLTVRQLSPENITRTAVLADLAQILGEPDEEIRARMPEWMQGDVVLPDAVQGLLGGTEEQPVTLSTRGPNVFADALDPIMDRGRLTPTAVVSQANPLIQLAEERRTGRKAFTGQPFSRPVPILDSEGREVATPPPLPKHLWDTLGPQQVTLPMEAIGSAMGMPERYDSGDPRPQDRNVADSALAAGRFMGVGTRRPYAPLSEIEERRQQSRQRQAGRLEKYRAQLEAWQQGQPLPE